MERVPSPYEKHVYVCLNHREQGACCAGRGSETLLETLRQYVRDHGLKGRVRINRAGCLDLCSQGPNIMVYPDQVWYKGVTADDLSAIIAEHLAPLAESSA